MYSTIKRFSHTLVDVKIILLLLLMSLSIPTMASDYDGTLFFNGKAGLVNKRAVYTVKEQPTLRLSIVPENKPWDNPVCSIHVFDMWDMEVYHQTALLKSQKDSLIIEFKPSLKKTGWYYIKVNVTVNGKVMKLRRFLPTSETDLAKGIEQFPYPMFAIVPSVSHQINSNSPIGLDIAISTLKSKKDMDALIELAAMTGVKWIRDRIAWQRVEPTPGQYNLTTYKENADKLYDKGIRTLLVFQNVPDWSKTDISQTFPDDLRIAYNFAKNTGRELYPAVGAWEIWNEHDIAAFNKEPPDQYAALLKAMALGYQSLSPKPKILLGPFARDPNVGEYGQTLFDNGVSSFLDAYSFHSYAPVNTGLFNKVLKTHFQMMKAGGLATEKPWLTETGFTFKKGMSPAMAEARNRQLAHMMWALPLALEAGVGKVYWFLLRPYYGAEVQIGTIDENYEPLPVYAAFAIMNNELNTGTFLKRKMMGDVPALLFRSAADVRAIVLSKDQETVVDPVLISRNSNLVDAMGNTILVKNEGGKLKVANKGWPFYINNVPLGSVVTQLSSAKSAAVRPSKIIFRVKFPAKNVITEETQALQNWDGLASKWAPRGYAYHYGQTVTARVEIYNFDNQRFTGTLKAILPSYVKMSNDQQPISIAPGERLEINITLQPGNKVPSNLPWVFEIRNEKEKMCDIVTAKWTAVE